MIAIDCRVVGNNTGVDYYTRDLIKAFQEIDVSDQIQLLINSEFQKDIFRDFENKKVIPPKTVLLDHLRFSSYVDKKEIKAVLHPDNTAFLSDLAQSFVILHDVLPWTHPETTLSQDPLLKLRQRFYLRLQEAALKKVRGLITVSNFSKGEIQKVLDIKSVASQQIQVIPESVSDRFSKPPTLSKEELLKSTAEVENYCFYIGGYEDNKNVPTLLKAFADSNYQGTLILGGELENYSNHNRIKSLITELSPRKPIKLIGKVTEDILVAWYTYADFFIYPPFYGGFGRPILEALKTGCPVIASKTSSFPEVGGESCIYFKPEDLADLTSQINQITQLIADPVKLEGLKQKLKEQADRFSWTKSASLIWQIING